MAWPFGSSSSKVTVLNESIAKVANSVVVEMASTAHGITEQKDFIKIGGGARVTGTKFIQDASIDITSIQDATVNADMQTEIINKILAEVAKSKSDFPTLGNSKSDTDITNIVKNEVSTTFDLSPTSDLSLMIKQEREIEIAGDRYGDAIVDGADFSQLASSIGEAVNTMSSNIVTKLFAGTDIIAKSDEKTTNFLSDIVDSVGGAVGNVIKSIGDIFGLSPMTVIVMGLVMIVLAFFGYMASGAGDDFGEDEYGDYGDEEPMGQMGAQMGAQMGNSMGQMGAQMGNSMGQMGNSMGQMGARMGARMGNSMGQMKQMGARMGNSMGQQQMRKPWAQSQFMRR
jgi:hypothetical protein